MSAAYWRRAMNASAASRAQTPPPTPSAGTPISGSDLLGGVFAPERHPESFGRGAEVGPPRWLQWLWTNLRPRHFFVMAALLVYPWIATPFFTFQIAGQALVMGLIALSLMFLGGYGGMVSLAQMTVAGIAGYCIAIFGTSGTSSISLGWPWWVAVLLALAIATICGTLIGWLAVRTEGIYTIMITLAVGVAFFYFAQQNIEIFNGFQGFQRVIPPEVFGINWREPMAFFYLALFWSLAGYLFVKYLARAPFGVALQGIRDNPRRMNALGFDVTAHRIAAYAVAGLIAAIGGVLLVWYNGLIVSGSVGTSALINILIIAVLGGMRHPIGPFIGAIIFVLLQNFAVDLVDRERFNLLIGGVFLVIVLFSSDGILGWWERVTRHFRASHERWEPSRPRPHQ
jgi:branched-chain amino acid transport system permease protein